MRRSESDADLLGSIRSHWRRVLALMATGLVVGLAATPFTTPQYSADASVELGNINAYEIYGKIPSARVTTEAAAAAAEMISPEVLRRAGLLLPQKYTVTQMRSAVTVVAAAQSPSVSISGRGSSARQAAAVANAEAKAYLDYAAEQLRGIAKETRNSLLAAQATVQQQLTDLGTVQQAARTAIEASIPASITGTERSDVLTVRLRTDSAFSARQLKIASLRLQLSTLDVSTRQTTVDAKLVAAGIDTAIPAQTTGDPGPTALRRNLVFGTALGLVAGCVAALGRRQRELSRPRQPVVTAGAGA